LVTSFRMGLGRVFLLDRAAMNPWFDSRLPICRPADKSHSLAALGFRLNKCALDFGGANADGGGGDPVKCFFGIHRRLERSVVKSGPHDAMVA
jgi:hypothetical protein